MRRLLTRMRASAGQLALLGVLTLVAGVLLTGAPRIAAKLTDEGLRQTVAGLPYQVRDISYQQNSGPALQLAPVDGESLLLEQQKKLPAQLRQSIGQSWSSVMLKWESTLSTPPVLPAKAQFGVRAGDGLQEAAQIVEGRWPQNTWTGAPALEVVLAQESAKRLGFKLGQDLVLDVTTAQVPIRVVGIFTPIDPRSPVWDTQEYLLTAHLPEGDGDSFKAIFLSDVGGLQRLAGMGAPLTYEWRYRVATDQLDMAVLPALVKDIYSSRRSEVLKSAAMTGLDTQLARFADLAQSTQALLAVVQAGVLATLAGLVVLAAGLAVNRRRAEFTLLRARGSTAFHIGARTLVEALPIVPVAAALGWYLGTLAPGRDGRTEPILIAFAAVALLAMPILAMTGLRRMSFSGEREDLGTAKVGLKRRTAELSLLALAGLGVWLLRKRGLTATTDVDVFLVSVPVLLAAGAAVLTLRSIPAPLSLASRVASRAKGTVGFLGLARAGRAAPASIGPIAVLVVAVCTTLFSIGVAATVSAGRDQATDHQVVGDARVSGYFFAPDTADQLMALPGVTDVAPVLNQGSTWLYDSREVDGKRLKQVFVVVVDGAALERVAQDAGSSASLPGTITGATRQDRTPILVSPLVARDLAGQRDASGLLQGRWYDFNVAGVVDSFPGLAESANEFVIVPWQGLPVPGDHPLNPTAFILSGKIDPAAATAIGDDGQQRWMSATGSPTNGFTPTTNVSTWDEVRSTLEQTGTNGVLSFAYSIGTVGGVALALLAVGFAVLAGARARGRVLSRLRTMGLSRRQGRRLLLVELAPIVTVAVLTGGVVGVALPQLIAPALGLTNFTGGYDAGVQLDLRVITGALGLVLVGLATALLVEGLFNRRMRLGEVLRLGSAE